MSFDQETTGGRPNGELNGQTGALVRTENDDDEISNSRPWREQTRLAHLISHEGMNLLSSQRIVSQSLQSLRTCRLLPASLEDPDPGDYWLKPTRAEMKKLPQAQLKHLCRI